MKNTVLQTVFGQLVGFELRRKRGLTRGANRKRFHWQVFTDDGKVFDASGFEISLWTMLPSKMRKLVEAKP